MNFIVPCYARRLLEGDHLERAEKEARRLGVRLQEPPSTTPWPPSMRDERRVLVKMLTGAGTDPEQIDCAIEYLGEITCVLGANDPEDEDSATPWLWLIGRLLKLDPKVAARAARAWYAALDSARIEAEETIPNVPFATYLAAVVSVHAGEDERAEGLLLAAKAEAEQLGEDDTAPFLQAVRWVRAVLRAGATETCAHR